MADYSAADSMEVEMSAKETVACTLVVLAGYATFVAVVWGWQHVVEPFINAFELLVHTLGG